MEKPGTGRDQIQERRTEEQELLFVESLVGMTITSASYSEESGLMLEFDNRIRLRSRCPHSSFYKRRIQ